MNINAYNATPLDAFSMVIWGIFFFVLIIKFFQSIRLVPTKKAYIVERLGKYYKTLEAGFHALIPFVDKVSFIQDLKEETIDVPPQDCFSKDEVNVEVDGVIYISVVDPVKASYGVTDYRFAAVQLAQTTTRSVIGTLDLDKTFEERDAISAKVVEVLDKAGELWGIKVYRYEIKNIAPPPTVKKAMEKQVNAERERRAILARSEGEKQSRINTSEGTKSEMINVSEGEMQRRINEAEGKVEEILSLAVATAESISKVANVIKRDGGEYAIKLQMAEKQIAAMNKLASNKTKIVLPKDIGNMKEWLNSVDITF